MEEIEILKQSWEMSVSRLRLAHEKSREADRCRLIADRELSEAIEEEKISLLSYAMACGIPKSRIC